MTTRTFIAVPMEHVALKELSYKVRHIAQKDKNKEINWLHEDAFHVTLDFIGRFSKDQLKQLEENLSHLLSEISPFYFTLEEIAFFPSPEKPRAVAAFIAASEELENLKEKVGQALVKSGLEAERKPFHPHITVGRPHKHHKMNFHLKREMMEIQSCAEKVIIYQSELKKKGAVYTVIHEVSLKMD